MPRLSLGPFPLLSHARHMSAWVAVCPVLLRTMPLTLAWSSGWCSKWKRKKRSAVLLFREVVLVSRGFVLWSNRFCSRVSDFGAALARVLGGCMPGIVEDDAVDLGLVLGLVLEVEEEGEERGLVILPEVVLIIRGFVPRSDRLCSRVSDFGVALVGVLVEVRVRLVVVEESPAVGRVVFVCLLAFVALEGVPVPPVLVVVRVRLVVVGASLVVGRAVLCLFWLCASFGFLSLLCKVCPTRMPT